MATRSTSEPFNMPLVGNPTTRNFRISGLRSEIVIRLTAAPNQSVIYEFEWARRPPRGILATARFQVGLLRRATNANADRLKIVTIGSMVLRHTADIVMHMSSARIS